MTALEIAIGGMSVFGLVGFSWWFIDHKGDEKEGIAAWFILASLFGTVWFAARLWGFA
jgi:hypothetical protein